MKASKGRECGEMVWRKGTAGSMVEVPRCVDVFRGSSISSSSSTPGQSSPQLANQSAVIAAACVALLPQSPHNFRHLSSKRLTTVELSRRRLAVNLRLIDRLTCYLLQTRTLSNQQTCRLSFVAATNMSSPDPMDVDDNEDLFGDEEDDIVSDRGRAVSDRELDSADDDGRPDEVHDTQDGGEATLREIRTQDILLARGRVPKPSNGEVQKGAP